MAKKSWVEKLDETENQEEIGCAKETPKGVMYIARPSEVVKIINEVPRGKLITTTRIIEVLTGKNKVDFTCPLTTGIWVSLIANASEERLRSGKKVIAPYWRVLKSRGVLYEKYLGELSEQDKYLKKEGFKIVKKGKNKVVDSFDKFLVK